MDQLAGGTKPEVDAWIEANTNSTSYRRCRLAYARRFSSFTRGFTAADTRRYRLELRREIAQSIAAAQRAGAAAQD